MSVKPQKQKESGKFVLRISSQMHASLKRGAADKNISLNEYIKSRLNSVHANGPIRDPLTELILKTWGDSVVAVLCFGSTVRNEQKKSSDIDLLIVLDDKVDIKRSLYREWDDSLAPHLDAKFSPQFVCLPQEVTEVSSIWLEVAIEGEFVFERDSAVRTFIYKLRQEIASGRYLRKITHGHPYWIRNINAKS